MAFRIGVVGPVNSGKSMSRKFIEDASDCFILYPSQKATYLFNKDKTPVKKLKIIGTVEKNTMELMKKYNINSATNLLRRLNSIPSGKAEIEVTGNSSLVKNIDDLPLYLDFINKHMPWIKNVFMADFTHYISEIISKKEFIERKHGNEAYQRFWELSGTALQAFITKSDSLRENMLIITEFHGEFDEHEGFRISIPAGNMLREKFKPDSYYDVLLCTKVVPAEDGTIGPDSYKFVTRKTLEYPIARSMDLFEEELIPNNMQTVLTAVREYFGI